MSVGSGGTAVPAAIPFLDLKAAAQELQPALEAACARVIASGWFVLGAEVEALEREFAAYCDAAHCVGVGNALDGLELALRALDIGPGDEVIVPSNTYIASWLAVSAVGAKPVPVEPDPHTFNLDPLRVEAAITNRTRALMPVHLYGRPAPLITLGEIARRYGLRVVEDAAQSHGARLAGHPIGGTGNGTWHSDAAVFSFYPTKNLGALGDGGAVVTDNPEIADRVRVLRNYGSRRKYENEVRGANSRLDEMQAALLRVKLPHLDTWNARRHRLATRYRAELQDCKDRLILPDDPNTTDLHAWHVFTVRCADRASRDELQKYLTAAGIGTQVFYPVPPHLSDAYADHGWQREDFPLAADLADTILSLPLHPHLSDTDQDRIIAAVRHTLSAGKSNDST